MTVPDRFLTPEFWRGVRVTPREYRSRVIRLDAEPYPSRIVLARPYEAAKGDLRQWDLSFSNIAGTTTLAAMFGSWCVTESQCREAWEDVTRHRRKRDRRRVRMARKRRRGWA